MLPRKLCPPVRERHKGRLLVTQVLLVTLQVTSAPLLAHGPVCLVRATPPPPLLGWSSELSTGSRPGHPKKQVPLPTGGMLPHTACQSAGGCHRPSPAPPRRGCNSRRALLTLLGLDGQGQGVGRAGFSWAAPLGLQTAAFSLCPHVAFTLCSDIPGVSSFSSPVGLQSHFMEFHII